MRGERGLAVHSLLSTFHSLTSGEEGIRTPGPSFSPGQRFSKPPHSTTLPPLRRKALDTHEAEGEGFEPPDLSVNGFQNRRIRPLCQPSGARDCITVIVFSRWRRRPAHCTPSSR